MRQDFPEEAIDGGAVEGEIVLGFEVHCMLPILCLLLVLGYTIPISILIGLLKSGSLINDQRIKL